MVNFNPRDVRVDEEITGKLLCTQQVNRRFHDHLSYNTAEFTNKRNKKFKPNVVVEGRMVMLKAHTHAGAIPKLSPNVRDLHWVLKQLSGH